MKAILTALFIVFLCAGCYAKHEYRVDHLLRLEMSQSEAQSSAAKFGYKPHEHTNRPPEGWPQQEGSERTLLSRAHDLEVMIGRQVAVAESYASSPTSQNPGQLFLFYSPEGHLLEFYRYPNN